MPDLLKRLQAALPERYTLERELGGGGMGTVYLARERHPDRQVAIKVLDPHLAARLGRDRFVREIDVTSKLTHPHIVPIFAALEAGGFLSYVMPYVSGETLADRIAREGQLAIDVALRIAADVADALAYAHERQVIHRDIKPSNILLHDDHALVTDFGVARAISVAGGEHVTESGVAVGTPSYMAPEQITADRQVDGRADVYALGCVLYEMLAGEPPFSGRDARAVMRRHMVDPIPPLRTLRDTVPPAVEEVVSRALAKAPADRFASARECAAAIAALRLQSASSWTTPLPATEPRRRRRWLRDVSVAVAALAVLALAWQPWRARGVGLAVASARYTDSLAVMPLVNQTGDPRYDYLAKGLADQIINRLSGVRELKVSALYSTEAYQAMGLTAPQLGDSLGVRHVVRGALTLSGDTLHAVIQHIDAHANITRWGDSFGEHRGDPYGAQVRIAERVSARVAGEIGGLAPLDTAPPIRAAPGYEAYLLGKHWLARRTPEGLMRAIAWFNEAITQNPEYAVAYADLSTAYALSLTYRYDIGVESYRAARLAWVMGQRAAMLDSKLAQAHAARGYIGALANAPTDQVAADFGRASALQPNAPSIPSWSARVLAKQGRVDEALAEAQRAADLDPKSASRHIAVAYWALRLGHYDRAAQASREALALEPELILPRALMARALLLGGRAAECLELDLGPHTVLAATCRHALGRAAEAQAMVDSVEADLRRGVRRDRRFTDVLWAEDLAVHYAWLGEADRALEWLARAYEMSPSGVETMVLESALFDRVRDAPLFARDVSRIRAGLWDRVRR